MKYSTKKKGLFYEIKTIYRGYKIICSIDKRLLFLNILYSLAEAIIPFISIIFSSIILTELVNRNDLKKVVYYIGITLILEMFLSFFKEIINSKIMIHGNQWNSKLGTYLAKVNSDINFEYLENSEITLLKNKIKTNQNATSAGIVLLLNQIGNLISQIFSCIIAMILFLDVVYDVSNKYTINSINVKVLVFVVILISNVVILICNIREEKREYLEWKKLPEYNRLIDYYTKILKDNIGAMDIRIYNQKNLIISEINKWTNNPQYLKNISNNMRFHGKIREIFIFIIEAIVYIYFGINVLLGEIVIGKFIQYSVSLIKFIYSMLAVCTLLCRFHNNMPYLEDFLTILDLPKEELLASKYHHEKGFNRIEFRNVSFKYPNTDKNVLDNISIDIGQNKRIAIVGENGSGKSTFIKLLCGLYDSYDGEILFDGKNIKLLHKEEIYKLFSTVFQDFNLFPVSLAMNVACDCEYDIEKVFCSLEKVGLGNWTRKLKDGIMTNLYRTFDKEGVEISGGEAQKIAIARAIYKGTACIIMDEPTAALDPVAEYDIYNNINNINNDSMIFFISHRLASCRFCDEILVFKEGKIVQKGNHEQLLGDTGGQYYRMWVAQEKYYQIVN